jgi:TRAP-type C4-dicarboxylate transport system permease small subunit
MFWNSYPPRLQRALTVLSDALMFIVWLLLVWRMGLATTEYRHNAEVTFILQMPVWWGYAASMPAAVVGVVAYAWRLLESVGVASPPKGFVIAGGGH